MFLIVLPGSILRLPTGHGSHLQGEALGKDVLSFTYIKLN